MSDDGILSAIKPSGRGNYSLAVDLPGEIMITSERRRRFTSAHVQRRAKITPPGNKPVPDSWQISGRTV